MLHSASCCKDNAELFHQPVACKERIGVGGSGVGKVGAFHFKYIEGISLFKASTSRL